MEYLSSGDTFAHVPIAESPVMKKIVKMCNTIAKTDSAVMITGESGTGKEVLARYIHRHSSRANEPFIPVNCAAIPHDLLEAEFFGYEKGAFTGANPKGKPGLFEMADKGTLFLDEIADLPLSMQSKLLRVLESGEIKHVGGTTIKHTDVRLISATNKNLREMIANKQFRADVYYRLSVIPITVPSLRERPEDILALSKKFLNGINAKYNFSKKLTRETIEAFYEYDWPGNVRELRNVIERLAITSVDDELHFEVGLSTNGDRVAEPVKYLPEITSRETLKNFMDRVEAEYIETVLAESNGRVSEAAKRLGIHRTLLYRKIREKINK
jgi:transcriptional regulator with PAS, ATPase and Fis domain